MSEPRRLLDEGGSEDELSILRAGRADGPSPGSRQKALIALGLAGSATVVTTAATATAGAALAESAGTVALLKWVGAGVLAGLLTIGGVYLDGGAPTPSPSPPPRPQVQAPAETSHGGAATAPVDPAPVLPVAPVEAPSASAPARTSPVASGSTARPMASLADEVAALDAARVALRAGDASGALRALDDCDRRFAGGMLGPEAMVLRIDALALRGDHASAKRLGEAFLAAHPRSPLASHVRWSIGAPSPVTTGSAPEAPAPTAP